MVIMMFKPSSRFVFPLVAAAALLGLSACGMIHGEAKYPSGLDRNMTGGDNNIYGKKESILGDDGLKIFGGKDKKDDSNGGIGVNAYLWRASLDTVSFMPLASADPFGGVILTDWYSDPKTPNERMKLNVFITGRELKADALKVRAFRQVSARGGWKDAAVADGTERKLEDSILARARQLRVEKLAGEH